MNGSLLFPPPHGRASDEVLARATVITVACDFLSFFFFSLLRNSSIRILVAFFFF